MTEEKKVQSISGCNSWIYTTNHIPYINNLRGVFEYQNAIEPSQKSEEIYHQLKKDIEYFCTKELVRRYRKYNWEFNQNECRDYLNKEERSKMGQFNSIFDIEETYSIKIKYHLDDDLIYTDNVIKVNDLGSLRNLLKNPSKGVPDSNVSRVSVDSFWVNVRDIGVKDWMYNNARFLDYTDEDTNLENQRRLMRESNERFCEFLSQGREKSEEEIQKEDLRDQKEELLFSPELVKNLPFDDKLTRLNEFLEFLKEECYYSNRHKSYNCPYFWIKDPTCEVIWEKDLDVFWKRVREESRRYLFPNWYEELNLEEKPKDSERNRLVKELGLEEDTKGKGFG